MAWKAFVVKTKGMANIPHQPVSLNMRKIIFAASIIVALGLASFFILYGCLNVEISAIDSATAGVASFSVVSFFFSKIHQISIEDQFWGGLPNNAVQVRSPDRPRKMPLMAKIVYKNKVRGFDEDSWFFRDWFKAYIQIWHPLFAVGHSKEAGSITYKAHHFIIDVTGRYLPLFLLSGTSIARFIMDEPIIPLIGSTG